MGANVTLRGVLLALLLLGATPQHHRKALFPSAHRVRRGTHSLLNPTFQLPGDDGNLLFEILLAGMQIQAQTLLIPDEELASMRRVEQLEVICEDVLPKKLSDIRRLIDDLARRRWRQRLSWPDFEKTVLTLVYVSQTVAKTSERLQKEAWADALMKLFGAVQRDLQPAEQKVDPVHDSR
ncbi:protein FAM180A [Oryzias melastigma]|uniref:Protein FAM180A-like n=1 Tax=Oryzias melastigma TaxID=30732 RepID=A0A3B3BCM8_ORYME|nr:protein FAM180A [Oryzias melastigma]